MMSALHMPDDSNQQTNVMRRPIAARSRPWAGAASRALIRMGLTPNQVSLASIGFALVAGVGLAASADITSAFWRCTALVLAAIAIQLRLLCNLLDGLMAVEGGLRSATGDLFNDVPDRFADAIILVGAGCAARHLPYGLTLGWLAAMLAVMTAYVRVLGAAGGVGHDFRGPMAKQQRMAIITLACIVSAFDPLWSEWAAARGWSSEGQIVRAALALIVIGCVFTIIRRLARIAGQMKMRAEQGS